jgi:DDE superfamily endonuclease
VPVLTHGIKARIGHCSTRAVLMLHTFDGSPPRRIGGRLAPVTDNLSTHNPASPYEAFPAAEARPLVERFDWHYTPKHGSWLDMAEAEFSVLSGQCLDRRIPDKQSLIEEVDA